jgi:predicted short-subunit dehydrogenase-like oxidoreductase (DUF2520 family)
VDLILLGPGRAGMAVSLAAVGAGHRVVAVAARGTDAAADAADRLAATPVAWAEPLPAAELLLVAVRDGAIDEVAATYAGKADAVGAAAHLSGLVPAAALEPLGIPVASFHPLQTMPTAEAGAVRLAGAWVAVTSDDDYLADRLFAFAASLGARPFELAEAVKALYHAAAAATANYPIAALALAQRLFERAGVPFEATTPLLRAVVDNVIEMGPDAALTGPIARGDVATLRAQIAAVRAAAPDLAPAFEAMARATARIAGVDDVAAEAMR